MSNGITDYLQELPIKESTEILNLARSKTTPFIFTSEDKKILKFHVLYFIDKLIITDLPSTTLKTFNIENFYTIKFNIGSEVYFLKTKFNENHNKVCIVASPVIQLKRRKEARYLIPDKWKQTASIAYKNASFNSRIIEISKSGAKLETLQHPSELENNQAVEIKFQIHKRAEIKCNAIVRFSLTKPNNIVLIGLEFTEELSRTNQERIMSIIEDIKLSDQ